MIPDLDPKAALAEARDRIARLNPALNAVLDTADVSADAEASATRVRDGQPLSPLDGMPVAVKANIALAGLPWHAGIGAYRDRVAAHDAESVRRLKVAGALVFATLNLEEGALGAVTDNPHFGRCFNPWGKGLTPGGSSGGSGAAVAAGLVPLALGTDTMGSVRIPAAYCGVVGHKPSRGAVPDEGVVPLSTTLDHVGPLARSVGICRAAFEILSGSRCRSASERPLTIGRWRVEDRIPVDTGVMAAFEAALEVMASAHGAHIVDIELPGYHFGASRRAGLLIAECEGAAVHAEALARNPEGFSPNFRKMLAWGERQSEEKTREAFAVLDACRAAARTAFERVDIIAAPTAAETAFRFEDPVPAGQADITAFADLAGIPATSVPSGLANGLPAAIQFMAAEGRDDLALDTAARYETARGPFPNPPGYS